MNFDYFWHRKDFNLMRCDFYRLLEIPENATNHQIISAFNRYVNLLKSKPVNDVFYAYFLNFLLQGLEVLLIRNKRMSYDAFRSLIKIQDETLDCKLHKQINDESNQNPCISIPIRHPEFPWLTMIPLSKRARIWNHVKKVLKEELLSLSRAVFVGIITLSIVILIYFSIAFFTSL